MINKKQFVGYMDKLQELNKIEEEINSAVRKLAPDFNMICFGVYTSLITKILHDVFEDQDDRIGYYIWERNFGKDAKLGDVTDKRGKPIPFKTHEDLYNMLIRNQKEKSK